MAAAPVRLGVAQAPGLTSREHVNREPPMTQRAVGGPVVVEPLDWRDEAGVASFYQSVLMPNFPPDELESEQALATELREGRARALVARTQDGSLLGGSVWQWFPGSQVLLLSYIAVTGERRSQGVGTRLLDAGLSTWAAEFSPVLIVAEVEDPRHYRDTRFGDPVRRVRLYQRIGARALPLPYFQPALTPGQDRVRHLMLMVLGGSAAPADAGQVDGQVIERFLAENLEAAEGRARPGDAEAQQLFAACRQPGGLPLLPVSVLPPPG
jgi:GNAT superfamily N-acetyltransferase